MLQHIYPEIIVYMQYNNNECNLPHMSRFRSITWSIIELDTTSSETKTTFSLWKTHIAAQSALLYINIKMDFHTTDYTLCSILCVDVEATLRQRRWNTISATTIWSLHYATSSKDVIANRGEALRSVWDAIDVPRKIVYIVGGCIFANRISIYIRKHSLTV